MPRLDPAVAQVRSAVRRSLTEITARAGAGQLVFVACSGGADSLALAAAVAFEAPRRRLRAGGVTVDHGLQDGSAEQSARVIKALLSLGLDPVRSVAVDVGGRGGPEAAARSARYAAIDQVTSETGAVAVLLGHTMDDQAETVLLGLARGSGARSLSGMASVRGTYIRPLLGLRRDQTRAACAALGLDPWDDPQNADPGYARARVRDRLLPIMEELLGPGVTEALARSADLLRADADVLDDLVAQAAAANPGLGAAQLSALPVAIRTRLLRQAAIEAGAPAGALNAGHVAAMDTLVTDWHGQRGADLPGGLRCERRHGRLHFVDGRAPWTPQI